MRCLSLPCGLQSKDFGGGVTISSSAILDRVSFIVKTKFLFLHLTFIDPYDPHLIGHFVGAWRRQWACIWTPSLRVFSHPPSSLPCTFIPLYPISSFGLSSVRSYHSVWNYHLRGCGGGWSRRPMTLNGLWRGDRFFFSSSGCWSFYSKDERSRERGNNDDGRTLDTFSTTLCSQKQQQQRKQGKNKKSSVSPPSILLRREVNILIGARRVDEALQRVWLGIAPLLYSSPFSSLLPSGISSLLSSSSSSFASSSASFVPCKNECDGKRNAEGGVRMDERIGEQIEKGEVVRGDVTAPKIPVLSLPVVFDWTAFNAVLYLCDICQKPQKGLDLLHAVRCLLESGTLHSSCTSSSASFSSSCVVLPSSVDWMKEERFLSLLLRLHCAVGNEKEATHLISFLLQQHLLRSRTASTYLQFCLTSPLPASGFPLQDRLHKANALYRECRKLDLPLSLADITVVGRLWVLRADEIVQLYPTNHKNENQNNSDTKNKGNSDREKRKREEKEAEDEIPQRKSSLSPPPSISPQVERSGRIVVEERKGNRREVDAEEMASMRRDVLKRTLDALRYLFEDLREQELAVEEEKFLKEVLVSFSSTWARVSNEVRLSGAPLYPNNNKSKDKTRINAENGVTGMGKLTLHVFTISTSPASLPFSSSSSFPSTSLHNEGDLPPPFSRPTLVYCTHCNLPLQKQPFTEEQRLTLLNQLEQCVLSRGNPPTPSTSSSMMISSNGSKNNSSKNGLHSLAPHHHRVRSASSIPASPSTSSSLTIPDGLHKSDVPKQPSSSGRGPKRNSPLHNAFVHWKRLLQQEVSGLSVSSPLSSSTSSFSRLPPYDIFIDGANVGYYGVSKWCDGAPTLSMASSREEYFHAQEDASSSPSSSTAGSNTNTARKPLLSTSYSSSSPPSPRVCEGEKSRKKCSSPVSAQLDFALIDQALRLCTTVYGFRRPLILLHARHCREECLTKENASILRRWGAERVVYASPFGSNDDIWWLYGALFLLPYHRLFLSSASSASSWLRSSRPVSGGIEKEQEKDRNYFSSGVHVLTNDKCRDHLFQFLSPRCFKRWREQFCIRFHCERVGGKTHLRLDWPPAYSHAPQEIQLKGKNESDKEVDLPITTPLARSSSSSTGKGWCWHIPIRAEGGEEEGRGAISPRFSSFSSTSEVKGMNVETSVASSHALNGESKGNGRKSSSSRKNSDAELKCDSDDGDERKDKANEEKWICVQYVEDA